MSKFKFLGVTILVCAATLILMTASPGSASAAGNYTVVRGDSLYSIAHKYGTSVQALKQANHLISDLIQIGQVLIIPGHISQPASRGSANRSALPTVSPADKGSLIAWQKVNSWFEKGNTAVLKDVTTGKQFQIYRLFGYNHADCEPLTAADTRIMKSIYDGKWSWTRRAVILLYDEKAVAASMAGMPHGSCQITNNEFSGHFDLHFLNSRTHGTKRVDPDHQKMVHRAAGQ